MTPAQNNQPFSYGYGMNFHLWIREGGGDLRIAFANGYLGMVGVKLVGCFFETVEIVPKIDQVIPFLEPSLYMV